MREPSLQSVISRKPDRITSNKNNSLCPLDHVNRQFRALALNMLGFLNSTCVVT